MTDSDSWADRKPNAKFPACAQIARRLLAEVSGCQPGDIIPSEDELLSVARAAAAEDFYTSGKARVALQMVEEIGGL